MTPDEAATVTNDRAESLRAGRNSDDSGSWVAGTWVAADEMPDRWDVA